MYFIGTAGGFGQAPPYADRTIASECTTSSVSYTHLDVYKRQSVHYRTPGKALAFC